MVTMNYSYFDFLVLSLLIVFCLIVATSMLFFSWYKQKIADYVYNPVDIGFTRQWSIFNKGERTFIHQLYDEQGCDYPYTDEYCQFVQSIYKWQYPSFFDYM